MGSQPRGRTAAWVALSFYALLLLAGPFFHQDVDEPGSAHSQRGAICASTQFASPAAPLTPAPAVTLIDAGPLPAPSVAFFSILLSTRTTGRSPPA